MGTRNFVWSFTKKFITFGLITVTVSDRYVTVVPVRGGSMSPTFNPKTDSLIKGTFLEKGIFRKIWFLQLWFGWFDY